MNELPDDPLHLMEIMKKTSTLQMFDDFVIFFLRKKLQNEVVPMFMKQTSEGSFGELLRAVESMYISMCWFYNYISSWNNAKDLKREMNDILKACLKWKMKGNINETFSKLLSFSLQLHLHGNEEQEEDDEEIVLEWKSEKETANSSEFCELIEEKFYPMVQTWLVEMELVSIVCNDAILPILETEACRFITRTCSGNYETRFLGEDNDVLRKWAQTQVLPWLKLVFDRAFDATKWEEKLMYILYDSYTKLRIDEMFDVITDFPESTPVLHDLKLCLQHTRLRPHLIKTLKHDITTRVLHPGASTQNIITIYIASVKALRELDISGVVMEMVLEPCTSYLTQREDAVRMIMQGLLWDDGANDLAAELAKNLNADETSCWNERTTDKPEDWLPDPREADPNKADKSSRTLDIVTLFIGMYGSKEKFIKEYQKLLSRRLLQGWYNEQKEAPELRNLELLKKRFGEEDMGKCAVMLKDIADSRRINSYVKEEIFAKSSTQPDMELHALVVSNQFWPEITNQDFELPSPLSDTLKSFNKGYESLKASRSLTWLTGVGLLDIQLELQDRTLEVRASPLQASIIYLFQDKDTWTLNELSDKLKIPATVLRRKMAFWLHQGVLKEVETDRYVTLETRDAPMTAAGMSSQVMSSSTADMTQRVVAVCDDEDDEDKEDSDNEREKKEKNAQVFWNYVQGMLKNLESLPLDRIHKMLQMFAMHDAEIQIELPQLRQLLAAKIQEGLVVLEQGKYKLVRDPS